MALIPWKDITWGENDLITVDQLAGGESNDVWLRDNTPRGVYTIGNRATGLKIACGATVIKATDARMASVQVSFGNIFSAGCRPIITLGCETRQNYVSLTILGIGQLHPDDRGFMVQAAGDQVVGTAKLDWDIHVNWIAMGY